MNVTDVGDICRQFSQFSDTKPNVRSITFTVEGGRINILSSELDDIREALEENPQRLEVLAEETPFHDAFNHRIYRTYSNELFVFVRRPASSCREEYGVIRTPNGILGVSG